MAPHIKLQEAFCKLPKQLLAKYLVDFKHSANELYVKELAENYQRKIIWTTFLHASLPEES